MIHGLHQMFYTILFYLPKNQSLILNFLGPQNHLLWHVKKGQELYILKNNLKFQDHLIQNLLLPLLTDSLMAKFWQLFQEPLPLRQLFIQKPSSNL